MDFQIFVPIDSFWFSVLREIINLKIDFCQPRVPFLVDRHTLKISRGIMKIINNIVNHIDLYSDCSFKNTNVVISNINPDNRI